MAIDALRIHELAIEAAATRHFAADAAAFIDHQRAALLELVRGSDSAPSRSPALREALMGKMEEHRPGLTALWVDARFVSPLIAAAAAGIMERVLSPSPFKVDIAVDDDGVFGLRLVGFTQSRRLAADRRAQSEFIMATALATYRALSQGHAFVLDAVGELDRVVDREMLERGLR
ncbi:MULTISPECIES: hypothetical protein [unclassified Xanthobacter]|uniref:hypothetical protein n=1 Tax=unclassified Xanthobacter TaxID=2623496 RepID=UPI001F1E676D|nr:MULTISPECIES: hypothetical protein [unclassified Xanthobacter]